MGRRRLPYVKQKGTRMSDVSQGRVRYTGTDHWNGKGMQMGSIITLNLIIFL